MVGEGVASREAARSVMRDTMERAFETLARFKVRVCASSG